MDAESIEANLVICDNESKLHRREFSPKQNKKDISFWIMSFCIILGRKDSNLRMPGPKPGALPLGDAPIILNFHVTCVLSTRQTKTHSSLSLSGLCTHQTNARKLAKFVVATPQYSFVTSTIIYAQASLSINKRTFFIRSYGLYFTLEQFFKH